VPQHLPLLAIGCLGTAQVQCVCAPSLPHLHRLHPPAALGLTQTRHPPTCGSLVLQVWGFQNPADPQPDQPQPDDPSSPRVAKAQDKPAWVMEVKKDLEILELKLTAELKLQAAASDAKLDKLDAKLDKIAAANDARLDKISADFRLWFFTLVAVLVGVGLKDLLPLLAQALKV